MDHLHAHIALETYLTFRVNKLVLLATWSDLVKHVRSHMLTKQKGNMPFCDAGHTVLLVCSCHSDQILLSFGKLMWGWHLHCPHSKEVNLYMCHCLQIPQHFTKSFKDWSIVIWDDPWDGCLRFFDDAWKQMSCAKPSLRHGNASFWGQRSYSCHSRNTTRQRQQQVYNKLI